MSDNLDLREMSIDEIYDLMREDLYYGEVDEIVKEVTYLLEQGESPHDILNRGLMAGMDEVGVDFRDGVLFVPEVLMAARAMKAGMEVLRPLLTQRDGARAGTFVIGTVKGDIHDIGKNLVGMMMEGAGFEVIDLGINVPAEVFVQAVREHKPDILGMSALLTTTMPYMRTVIQALEEANLRRDVVVFVGGAPVNDAFAEEIHADAYCRDAAVAVETAKKFIMRNA